MPIPTFDHLKRIEHLEIHSKLKICYYHTTLEPTTQYSSHTLLMPPCALFTSLHPSCTHCTSLCIPLHSPCILWTSCAVHCTSLHSPCTHSLHPLTSLESRLCRIKGPWIHITLPCLPLVSLIPTVLPTFYLSHVPLIPSFCGLAVWLIVI